MLTILRYLPPFFSRTQPKSVTVSPSSRAQYYFISQPRVLSPKTEHERFLFQIPDLVYAAGESAGNKKRKRPLISPRWARKKRIAHIVLYALPVFITFRFSILYRIHCLSHFCDSLEFVTLKSAKQYSLKEFMRVLHIFCALHHASRDLRCYAEAFPLPVHRHKCLAKLIELDLSFILS